MRVTVACVTCNLVEVSELLSDISSLTIIFIAWIYSDVMWTEGLITLRAAKAMGKTL